MPDAQQTIKLKATDEASGVFEAAGRRIKAVNAEARAEGENLVGKAFESSGNLVGAGLKLLGIGLAGEIAEQLGDAFKESSAKLVEMQAQLREGKANAADFANEFAKSIPILGGFVAGFENLRELITGEKDEIALEAQEIEAQNQFYEAQLHIAEQIRDIHREALEIQQHITEDAKIAAMVGVGKERTSAALAEQDAISAAQKKYDDSRRSSAKDPQTKAARDSLVAENKKNDDRIYDLQNGNADILTKTGLAGNSEGENDELRELLRKRDDYQSKLKSLNDSHGAEDVANQKLRDEEIAKAKADRANKELEIDRQAKKTEQQQQYDHDQKVNAIRAEGAKAALEAAGEGYKAEQQGLADQRAAELADAKHRRDLAIQENPDYKTKIAAEQRYLEESSAIKGKYGAMASALARRQGNEQIDHADQLNDQLAQGKIDALKQEGMAGNIVAAGEARRAEIQEQFNKKRQEYNRILRDENATMAQKAEAQRLLGGLDASEQRELLFGQVSGRRFQLNQLSEQGRTTGVGAKAREENDPFRQLLVQYQATHALEVRQTAAAEAIAAAVAGAGKEPASIFSQGHARG